MAEKIVFPITTYNAAGQSAVSDSLTQLDVNKAKGFTQGYRHQSFPTRRWHKTTGETVRVLDKKQLDALSEDWIDTPVEPPEEEKPAEAPQVEAAMIRDLRAEIATLASRVDWLESVATAPPDEKDDKPLKPKRGPMVLGDVR